MENKINILFRVRSLEMGGVQKVLLEYLKKLPKDRFDISLMVNLCQGELVNEVPKDIKVYSIAKGKEFLSKNPIIHKIQLVFRRLKLSLYEKFPQLIYKKLTEKPDIEIAFDIPSFSLVANSPIKNSKKIAWLHNDLKNTFDDSVSLNIIEIMKRFDACCFVSKYAKDNIKKYFDTEFKSSYVINNPISFSEIREKAQKFTPKLSHPCFVAVGRLRKGKGYHELLKVHKRLIDNSLNHFIYLLGDGEQKAFLKENAENLGVENSFILLGNENNPYPYMQAADFFVHPSLRESYPMVILESLALEKPIVSTNVGGIPEMIENGVDGVLVNYDEDEIFHAMKKYLTDSDFVEKIKLGTQNADKKFDESRIYQQITEVFEKVYHS